MSDATAEVRRKVEAFRTDFHRLVDEIQKDIVGYHEIVKLVCASLFARGHVLLEGVPGLGKTRMVKALSAAIHTAFSRIQFTPDLMPADIVGTTIVVEDEAGRKSFTFQRGPIFANVVLADEINRATPKTQSALLEAMQEHAVTIGDRTHRLDEPFFVLGTQNPLEMEGTYPLPEAQLDRFLFKVVVDYLDEDALCEIVDRTTANQQSRIEPVLDVPRIIEMSELVRDVPIADHVKRYAVRLTRATHPRSDVAPGMVNQYVKFGASPRGIQSIILGAKVRALSHGRFQVACEDVREICKPALRHRLILNFEGEAEDVSTDQVLDSVLQAVPEIRESQPA
ncbi:MAG: MoxR family ATPase [Planctomycetes bacterium]|nr:MoxR family ATPase [Planctomycetota bacterium]